MSCKTNTSQGTGGF